MQETVRLFMSNAKNVSTFLSSAFWCLLRRNIPSLIAGALLAILGVNIAAGPGTSVIAEGEAEGPAFSDPDPIDLLSHVNRRRDCPAQSQRWAWRMETYNGRTVQHLIPRSSTVAPFLADSGEVMVTVSARDVPDRLQKQAGWKYRIVTAEQCGWLPEWLSQWFGPRLSRSKDQPLNFVGDVHHE